MDNDQFNVALARTRIQPRAAEVARMVLVDGLSAAEAGRRVGMTRETARAAAARVERAWRDMVGCPPGWQSVTVCIPLEAYPELMDLVEKFKS